MQGKRQYGAIVTGLVTVGALCAIGFVFIQTASPYVTIPQAKTTKGHSLHVAGSLVQSTIQESSPREILFTMKDAQGNTLPVDYKGQAVANINDAKQVVAIGGCENGVFMAHQLLVKCPSKYDDNQGAASLLKKGGSTY